MLFSPVLLFLLVLRVTSVAQGKSVFAHFMVGNTEAFGVSNWEANIETAQQAKIDAFALNIAHGWSHNDEQIANAFTAASAKGFKLFFSFDYAGGDVPWPLAEVRALIQKYGASAAHFQYQGKPFVSTFEGPDNADDWNTIKADTGCFFIPDWSSLGAGPALDAGGGVADGLFNWAAWPYGERNMTTYIDAAYHGLLGSKPYMMPVSPWFFTNLPGYSKNWLWKSGDLWYDRWKQVTSMDFEPEFLEIISWNDYGESHYIGPLDDSQYEAFTVGDAPYNYVKEMPHDGWRTHLPFLIDLYKTGSSSVTKESMVTWFRTSLNDVCADGSTTANTASQLQFEYLPGQVMPDRIYFSVLLASPAELKVSFGGTDYSISNWDYTPDGGVGIYHTSIPVLGTGGAWRAQVVRGGSVVIDYSVPQGISGSCPSGVVNWNPWVGSASASGSVSGKPPRDLSEQTCIQGWGEGNFNDICKFTCKYGYCPSSACVCTNMGEAIKRPKSTGVLGYPANGDANYGGLCNFACNLGYCPSTACSTEKHNPYVPKTSPFNPNTCTDGGGHGTVSRLCSWTCHYGFCPIHSCFCTRQGPLNLPPPTVKVSGVKANFGNDNGLCAFACSHGYCPSPECSSDGGDGGGDDDGNGSGGGSPAVNVVVGYFQADSITRRGCAQRSASFVPTNSVTHVNAAFAWVEAGSFSLIPGSSTGIDQLKQLTALKSQARGLHVWLTLGGYDFSTGSRRASDTEGIFADIVRTSQSRQKFLNNLASFMQEFAFDGVDIDWQWPAAGDESKNYALLIQEMRLYFNSHSATSSAWGISFTAPVEKETLARFDLATMADAASWINLVAYDADSKDQSVTRAMSDQKSIEAAVDALGSAGVPATKINLGIGFFGRSYTLGSTSCSGVGCAAVGAGISGQCTGRPGFMSYDEMSSNLGLRNSKVDESTGINYLKYWISYEDRNSIIKKVKYAQGKGLLGIAVWSIDLDDDDHHLLNATLYPGGLGSFALATGTDQADSSNYTSVEISSCAWSDCGTSTSPSCPPGQQVLTTDRCNVASGTGEKLYKALCCPFGQTPDSSTCDWNRLDGGDCGRGCADGQVPIASGKWLINKKGQENYCFFGMADYCCAAEESGPAVCGWENKCVATGTNGLPTSSTNVCSAGRKFVTYAKDSPVVGACKGDGKVNSWVPYCCDQDVDVSSFKWSGVAGTAGDGSDKCNDARICPLGKTSIATSYLGAGKDCTYFQQGYALWSAQAFPRDVKRTLCADPNALRRTIKTLPVPLENIFPHPGPGTDEQRWQVELDPTMGGADPTPEESTNADKNSLGWYIMSGPKAELTSLDKRDGSHWELFDCEPGANHEGRQTVRAVCTDSSYESNCGVIHEGHGVAGTVIEMPAGCGPGRYAMAVSLEPSQNQSLPRHLEKRADELADSPIFDLTFDYDFSPLKKRAGGSNVLLRIDYSDDPGYWNHIVAAAPTKVKRSRREMEEEVQGTHGGNYHQYLYHLWTVDKRSTPEDELHDLHARWFSKSGAIKDWIDRLHNVDTEYELVRHTVNEQFRWNIYDESVSCNIKGVDTTGYFTAWADLNVNIQSSALVTLIGNLQDLNSFEESHVLFRNSGSVKASINAEALAHVEFLTGEIELFGLENFGGTFTVPGIVTIGPNFRVLGQLQGSATLHGTARVDLTLAEWDYTQQYPDANGGASAGAVTAARTPKSSGVRSSDSQSVLQAPKFYYDVDASGELTLSVVPKVTLGIVFNDDSVSDASIDFGVNGRVTLYGSAGSSSDSTWQYCYGVNGDVEVFAQLNAPTLFGKNINTYYPVWGTGLFPIIQQTCAAAASSVSETTPSAQPARLMKRGDFIGSLICPASASASDDVTPCPFCWESSATTSDASSKIRRRYGYVLEERADDACPLYTDADANNLSCTLDDLAARGTIVRRLTSKDGVVDYGTEQIKISFGQYAGCNDAKTSSNILRSIIFSTSGRRCNANVFKATNTEARSVKLNTEHVYEAQTLTKFFMWLMRGPGVTVGSYTMPTAEWVLEVLLGVDIPGAQPNSFIMNTAPLGVNMPPVQLDTVLIWGFGRSDGVGPSPFTKARGESHLVLVDEMINKNKGKFMMLQKVSVQPETQAVNSYRTTYREVFGVFEYLRWSPPSGTGGSGPFPVIEPVWNKWMRVSNWFDLVLWEFDNQYAGRWNERAGAPVNSNGSPSLRALYARYIEDYLLAIEQTAALKSNEAKTAYENKFKSVNSLGNVVWSNTDDPNWFNAAFGAGGWASPAGARFPRPGSGGTGWSIFGATGNPTKTINGQGVAVNIGAPARI
ncbi:glycosyl hydrolase family 18 [Colletotrichum abscissum]|uniref:chitinase n=1 Tax=Colletotrichum abscissum TaxID=1671311 RepID=A0A9P9X6E4_9PEZI|nr:glycosyl hydrolase family 18 [Colletotrichum abscissum]KAI3537270.1 glycosyl hydrolase family 18 [Colletotrichum abscissum]KAK1476240.1 glycosyl hydrolase family 18 [Colletotrichum abscissum]